MVVLKEGPVLREREPQAPFLYPALVVVSHPCTECRSQGTHCGTLRETMTGLSSGWWLD